MSLSTPLNCHVMALRLLILTLVTSCVCVSNFHVHATTSTSSSTPHCTEYNKLNEIPCRDNIWGPVQWRRSLSESNADDYDEAYFYQIQDHLDARRTLVEDTVFVSYQFHYAYQQPPSTTANTNEEPTNAKSNPFPSTWYTYPDLLSTLLPMSINGVGAGPSSKHFYLGQVSGRSPSSSASTSLVYGLVNLAAFLSHAMTVSIQYDVCDEFHVDDQVESQYAIANSCGQFGRDNQLVDIVGDSACRGIGAGAGEVNDDGSTTIMIEACPVELNASVTGVTSLWGERSPPPLQCGPKESEDDYTGYWDVRDGVLYENYPFANRAGRIHNEGCCWWGRGILMTRGTCNFGKLNYYLGKSAASQGFLNWFDVDFCVYPEIVCDGAKELRWATGYFEWMDRVQDYVNMTSGWGYLHELEAFVERNFDNHTGFIDMVGHALPYGCSEEKCEAIEAKVAQERRDNFQMLVFDVLEIPKLVKTPAPSRRPTNQPVAFIDPVDPSEGPSNNENVPPNDGPSVQTTEYPMFVGRPITPTPVSPQIPSGSVQTNSPMVDIPETPPILTPVNPPSMTNNPKPTSTLTPTAAPVKNPVNPQSEPPETPPIIVPPQPPSPPTPPGGLSTTPPPTIKITDPPPTQLPENPATIVVVERPTYMPTYLDTSLITLQSGSNSNMKRNSSLLGFPFCLFFLLLLR